MAWTEERTALCHKMWAEGASAADIAAELGHGLTRNAVIGRVHRDGLHRTRKSQPTPMKRGRRVRTKAVRAVTFAPQAQEPSSTGPKTLIDIRPSDCRFPINDPDRGEPYLFCAAPRMNDEPYCAEHCRVAFRVGPYVPWQRRTG